jgi:hypothetical protein
MRQIAIVYSYTTRIGRYETHDHVERGRLASAVRSEQTDDLASADLER